ncbi:unnamed protein product, partial [Meganyctiphanes norvegica]
MRRGLQTAAGDTLISLVCEFNSSGKLVAHGTSSRSMIPVINKMVVRTPTSEANGHASDRLALQENHAQNTTSPSPKKKQDTLAGNSIPKDKTSHIRTMVPIIQINGKTIDEDSIVITKPKSITDSPYNSLMKKLLIVDKLMDKDNKDKKKKYLEVPNSVNSNAMKKLFIVDKLIEKEKVIEKRRFEKIKSLPSESNDREEKSLSTESECKRADPYESLMQRLQLVDKIIEDE